MNTERFLSEMGGGLAAQGTNVPSGLAVMEGGYWSIVEANGLKTQKAPAQIDLWGKGPDRRLWRSAKTA